MEEVMLFFQMFDCGTNFKLFISKKNQDCSPVIDCETWKYRSDAVI